MGTDYFLSLYTTETHAWSSQRLFTIACKLLREVFIRLNSGPTFYLALEDSFHVLREGEMNYL